MADGRLRRAKLAFERNFTQIPNEWLRDPNMSLKAIGLLALLMSHDEGFTVTQDTLAKRGPDGRTIIESAVKELKANDYLEIVKTRGSGGRIEGYLWDLTDPAEVRKRRPQPLAGFPAYGKPVLRETRSTENQHLKEQQPQEHLNQDLTGDPSTGAGINEDASGDSHPVATSPVLSLYERLRHQPCPFRTNGGEHSFAPTLCTFCGINTSQRWVDGDIRYLSDFDDRKAPA